MTSTNDESLANTQRTDTDSQAALFQRFGGEAFFEDFAREFYAAVAGDPLLRAMYPEEDLAPAQRRFQLFLQQYWGGPTTYSQERGHPRLRMRHSPFAIDSQARDHWLACAAHAFDAATRAHHVADTDATQMWTYLVSAANAMINTFDEF